MVSEIKIGDIIRIRREMLGISQTELAEGIMHISNLSKLENGRQIPTRINLEMLLERLGIDEPELLESNFTCQERELKEKKQQLDNLIFLNKADEAEKIISELQQMKEFGENPEYKFNRQYLLTTKAAVSSIRNDVESVKKYVDKALSITAGGFDKGRIAERLYTNYELELINMLSLCYSENGDRANGIEMLKALVKSMERSCMGKIISRHFFMGILYNLSKYLSLESRNQEALETCNRGINLCYERSSTYALPGLYYNKACILHDIDNKIGCKAYLELSCNLLYEMGKVQEAKYKKNHSEKRFGMALNVIFIPEE